MCKNDITRANQNAIGIQHLQQSEIISILTQPLQEKERNKLS